MIPTFFGKSSPLLFNDLLEYWHDINFRCMIYLKIEDFDAVFRGVFLS
jgi:hypothetical protein